MATLFSTACRTRCVFVSINPSRPISVIMSQRWNLTSAWLHVTCVVGITLMDAQTHTHTYLQTCICIMSSWGQLCLKGFTIGSTWRHTVQPSGRLQVQWSQRVRWGGRTREASPRRPTGVSVGIRSVGWTVHGVKMHITDYSQSPHPHSFQNKIRN